MHSFREADEAGEVEGAEGLEGDAEVEETDSQLSVAVGEADGGREGEGYADAGSGAVYGGYGGF